MAYPSSGGERYGRGYDADGRRLRAGSDHADSYDREEFAPPADYGTGAARAVSRREPVAVDYEDRPTSTLPSYRERSVQAAATAAEAERRGLMYRLARERMNNRRGTDTGLLVVRAAMLLLLMHGIPKMMNFSGFLDSLRALPLAGQAPQVVGYAVVIGELALPVLLFFGIATRLAGVLLALQMALTYAVTRVNHEPLLAGTGGLNHEAALLYAAIALLLACSGAGRISLDHGIGSDRRERRAEREADRMAEE